MTGRAVALPAVRPLGALWRFSRPHTIIGTTVSIVALYLIAVDTLPGLTLDGGLFDLFWTLVAGLAVNVYIVGINQLEDVEIDRINKPFPPGEITGQMVLQSVEELPLPFACAPARLVIPRVNNKMMNRFMVSSCLTGT